MGYGCTEQTLSRFLPAVIVTKTLMDQGLKPGSIRDKVFGGIETRHTRQTHPKGKKNIAELDAFGFTVIENAASPELVERLKSAVLKTAESRGDVALEVVEQNLRLGR